MEPSLCRGWSVSAWHYSLKPLDQPIRIAYKLTHSTYNDRSQFLQKLTIVKIVERVASGAECRIDQVLNHSRNVSSQ
jgi:hypothetical protein